MRASTWPRSVALATELGLARLRGTVVDRGDYLVVATPDDPSYYYGNLLVLPAPIAPGELPRWRARFAAELGDRPEIGHVTFWWDTLTGERGAAQELVDAGFGFDTSSVLTLTAAPIVRTAELAVRPLTPAEVTATYDLGLELAPRLDDEYRTFLRRRVAWQRELVARGQATFWGALDGDRVIASAGVVELAGDGERLWRHQDVQTSAPYRNRGLASALLTHAAAAAFARGATRVVLLADPGSDAERLYQRLGYRVVETTVAATRPPS